MAAIGTTEDKEKGAAVPLGYNRILKFYFPLALSWILMSTDGPIAVAVLSRLPGAEVNTAAFSVLMSIALWIESPIIDLLSTSTTLATSRAHFLLLRRFTLMLMGAVTAVHVLVLQPDLYHLVSRHVFGLTAEVAHAAWLGLVIVVPWSACIGWRRFSQGILIRNGITRPIGIGTALRVATMAGVALLLLWQGSLPGIQVVAASMVASVAAESAFIHYACRKVLRRRYDHQDLGMEGDQISMGRLALFHFPLTATTAITMFSFPTITSFLSRTDHPVLTLASWQVAVSVVFMMRTATFALPEAVIALVKDHASSVKLARFSLTVGIAFALTMVLAAVSGTDIWLFERVLHTKPEIALLAHLAFWVCALLPIISAVQAYLRGMLTASHQTPSRLWAMASGYAVLLGCLFAGLGLGIPGVAFAGVAMTLGLVAELIVLALFWSRHQSRAIA